jgi:hypothetical protein
MHSIVRSIRVCETLADVVCQLANHVAHYWATLRRGGLSRPAQLLFHREATDADDFGDDINDELSDAGCDEAGDTADDEIVLQQIMRIRDRAGRESIYATLRAEFLPGQQYGTLHVAFCPAFVELPAVEVELMEGPDADVRVVQVMHHGAQLEVRLSQPATRPAYCTVELAAYLPSA